MKYVFSAPKKYHQRQKELADFLKERDLAKFVEQVLGLSGLSKLKIGHSAIGKKAEFREPDEIWLDFRNEMKYMALCIAHEYVHLLIRKKKIKMPYETEQAIAVLTQLQYEDWAGIRKFTKKIARELLIANGAWPAGKILLAPRPIVKK